MDLDEERIAHVRVLDLESGRESSIATKAVVNAAGVWTDDVERLAGEHGDDVQASKGVHFLVPRDRIDSETGIILRTRASVLFVIPWGEHWIIGTTDTPWSLHRAHPAASRSDIEYLLTWVNTRLSTPLAATDIVGVREMCGGSTPVSPLRVLPATRIRSAGRCEWHRPRRSTTTSTVRFNLARALLGRAGSASRR
jgi:glycerol-3-phosphate dehydrogenase